MILTQSLYPPLFTTYFLNVNRLSPYVFLHVLTRRYSVKYFHSEFRTTSLCPSSFSCPAHNSLLDFVNLTVLHDIYTSQTSSSFNILFLYFCLWLCLVYYWNKQIMCQHTPVRAFLLGLKC